MKQAKDVDTYDDVKAASVRLSDALQAIGTIMYQQSAEEGPEASPPPGQDEDVIDAEFEEK